MDSKTIKNDAQRLADELVNDAVTGKLDNPSTVTSSEDINRFRKLKAQEAWIKLNKQTLDRMEKHKNGLLRILVIMSLINLFINLLILFL